MLEPRFCFRISAEAGLAYDIETGENTACYTQIKAGDKSLTKDEYDRLHEVFREMLAEQIDIDVDLIECISQEEYDEKVDDEGY